MERPSAPSDSSSLLNKFAPWCLLAVFALLCFMSQRNKSITVDEFSHFPSGLFNVLSQDWRMDRKSPPLVKCFPAVTCLITKPRLKVRKYHHQLNTWTFGYEFMFRNFENYISIFEAGRCAIIFLGCLAGFLLYKFAAEICGRKGALFALFLYAFNPNIIAHSRLTTIDAGATCMFLLSIYSFFRFTRNPRIGSASLAGAALGLAQLGKFTALILYPVFFLILTILASAEAYGRKKNATTRGANPFLRYAALLILMILVSLVVINAGYLFSGTLTPLNEYAFQSRLLRGVSSLLDETLPVPLPQHYVSGFDGQLALSEGGVDFYTGYLMGEHSSSGWWYYYFAAFFVKNPLALSAVILLTFFAWFIRIGERPGLHTYLCVWTPLLVFFIYFSFCTNIPIGVRFLLPMFPLIFLAACRIFSVSWIKGRMMKVVMIFLILAYAVPTLAVFPNYLSYFNLAAGGPGGGHRWLIDSNLDWGQDLPGLKEYMTERGIDKVNLGYFGRADPKLYGIDHKLAGPEKEEGVTVISVNFLKGRPYYLMDPDSKEVTYIDEFFYSNYRNLKPSAIVNHTLYVFE